MSTVTVTVLGKVSQHRKVYRTGEFMLFCFFLFFCNTTGCIYFFLRAREFLVGRRKLENSEQTHVDMGRTCKTLHRQKPEPGDPGTLSRHPVFIGFTFDFFSKRARCSITLLSSSLESMITVREKHFYSGTY